MIEFRYFDSRARKISVLVRAEMMATMLSLVLCFLCMIAFGDS